MELEQKGIVEKANSTTDLELGYIFSPACHPNQLHHRKLDITLHDKPTLRHYDPKVVLFRVAPDLLGNSVIKVRHPWKGKEKHYVFASTVIMRDRVDKVVESFTFGGELLIVSDNERTRCSLISTAPILPLLSWSSVETILAEEVEILLAKRMEVWDEQHKRISFEKHLAEVDPFILYLSCLENLQNKFSHFPSPVPEDLLGFIHFLQVEIKQLHSEGIWPLYLPQIAEIL
jgi:hypothetical protein